MLDLPAPRLRAYARETVIAEKFQAMVALGRANSRMKSVALHPGSLADATEGVAGFIMPHAIAAAKIGRSH
jgi:hypothetical protein